MVHGGAGNIPDYLVPAKMDCVKKAAIAGFKVLKQGGTSLEAVETAVRVMEDDPIMNAGKIKLFFLLKQQHFSMASTLILLKLFLVIFK